MPLIWLIDYHSTQNRSFRRCPQAKNLSWFGVENKTAILMIRTAVLLIISLFVIVTHVLYGLVV